MSNKKRESTPKVKIRQYKPTDIEVCRALWIELTDWHREIYLDPTIGGNDPGHYFDEHLKQVGREHVWVAEKGNKVIGMTGIIIGENEAELEPLVVKKEYRSYGIGSQLVKKIIDEAKKIGVQTLKVRPVARNDNAIIFFHRRGFDVLGHIDLFMDLTTSRKKKWTGKEKIAGKEFRK